MTVLDALAANTGSVGPHGYDDELRLVAAARDGDVQAFGELVRGIAPGFDGTCGSTRSRLQQEKSLSACYAPGASGYRLGK